MPAAFILRDEIPTRSNHIQRYQLAQSRIAQIQATPSGNAEKKADDLWRRNKLAQAEVRADRAAEKTGYQYCTKEGCFRNGIEDRADRDDNTERRGQIDGETGRFHFRPYEIGCKKISGRISEKQNDDRR